MPDFENPSTHKNLLNHGVSQSSSSNKSNINIINNIINNNNNNNKYNTDISSVGESGILEIFEIQEIYWKNKVSSQVAYSKSIHNTFRIFKIV